MNPFDALATFALGKIKEGIWAQWLKFLFELLFSAVTSFLFICGSVLCATRSPSLSTLPRSPARSTCSTATS